MKHPLMSSHFTLEKNSYLLDLVRNKHVTFWTNLSLVRTFRMVYNLVHERRTQKGAIKNNESIHSLQISALQALGVFKTCSSFQHSSWDFYCLNQGMFKLLSGLVVGQKLCLFYLLICHLSIDQFRLRESTSSSTYSWVPTDIFKTQKLMPAELFFVLSCRNPILIHKPIYLTKKE